MQSLREIFIRRIREIIFGLEDGLVSTLGVVTGIAEGTQDRFVIILAGLVVIFVESLSMAAGTYLSNKSEKEAHFNKRIKFGLHQLLHIKEIRQKNPTKDAVFMGISYMIGGTIPIIPYLLLPLERAIAISVIITIATLFLVGVGKGKLTQTDPLKSGIEMAVISFSAALIGFIIGKSAALIFHQDKL